MAFKKFTLSEKMLLPDGRFNSRLVSKFINCLMNDGKKSVAQRVMYNAMDRIAEKIKDVPPLEVFERALDNVKPEVEVRSKRVGGANYQVPCPVSPKRKVSLAIRWILDASRGGGGRSMSDRLSDELMAAYRREGAAMTTRDNVHRMADANRAFAHFGGW